MKVMKQSELKYWDKCVQLSSHGPKLFREVWALRFDFGRESLEGKLQTSNCYCSVTVDVIYIRISHSYNSAICLIQNDTARVWPYEVMLSYRHGND